MSHTEQMREAFEAWAPPAFSRAKTADHDGDLIYCDDWMQGAWVAFQELKQAALTAPAAEPQATPIPYAVHVAGRTFEAGTPFCDVIEHMEKEAARLVWAMGHMGMSNEYSRNFTTHVLRVGGTGDIHDCRTFIDAHLHARQEQPK